MITVFLKGKKDSISEFDAVTGIRGNQKGIVLCAGKLGYVDDGVNAQLEARSEWGEIGG